MRGESPVATSIQWRKMQQNLQEKSEVPASNPNFSQMFGWFLALIWLGGIGKLAISTELLTFDSSSEVGVVVEQRRKFWSLNG